MKAGSGIRVSRGVTLTSALWLSLLSALVVTAPVSASPADTAQSVLLADVQLQSQSLAKAVLQIDRANTAAYAQLTQAYAGLNADMKVLLRGGTRGSCKLAAPGKAAMDALRPMQEAMGNLEKAVELIQLNREAQTAVNAAVAKIGATSEALAVPLEAMIEKTDPSGQGYMLKTLGQLNTLRVRINLSAERLRQPELLTPENAFMMGKDANVFGETLEALITGSPALKLGPAQGETKTGAEAIAKVFAPMKDNSNIILQNLQRLVNEKEVVEMAVTGAEVIASTSQKLIKPVSAGQGCGVN